MQWPLFYCSLTLKALGFLLPVQHWGGDSFPSCKFRNFLFGPNSIFNIRKSHKISGGKALYFRSYQQETSLEGGGWRPPVPLGLNVHTFFDFSWYMVSK